MRIPTNKLNGTVMVTAALLAVSACGPVNRSVESIKAPEIKTATLLHDVRFEGATLGGAERQALREYLASVRVGYGDRISLDDPVAAGAAGRRGAVEAVVAEFGLFLEEAAPVTSGALSAGFARVVVARSRAVVAPCPDWRRGSNPEMSSSAMSNYGCASRGNLAAMIADPNDLVTAREYTGTDAMTAAKPVRTLKERISKPPETLIGLSSTKNGN